MPDQPPGRRPDGTTILAFVAMVLLGGSNAVAVRFSNLELPPFWGAASRFVATAVLFWAIVAVRGAPVPRGRALFGASFFGLVSVGGSYAFLYWALTSVTASLTMVVLSIGPLLTLFFARAHGLEPLRGRGLAGSLLAFAGILIAVGDELGVSVSAPALLALIAGAACIAEGSVLFKTFPRADPLTVNAVAVTTGAALLALVSSAAREPWTLPTTATTWVAFAYLVFVGSVVVFYLYLFVLSRWTASATSYAFLLFPVATVVIGAWLAGEDVTPRFLLGGAIVLAGVWVGAFSEARPVPLREA